MRLAILLHDALEFRWAYSDLFLPHTQKPTYSNNEHRDLIVLVDDDIIDITDAIARRIINGGTETIFHRPTRAHCCRALAGLSRPVRASSRRLFSIGLGFGRYSLRLCRRAR